jgi:hypothetical protein
MEASYKGELPLFEISIKFQISDLKKFKPIHERTLHKKQNQDIVKHRISRLRLVIYYPDFTTIYCGGCMCTSKFIPTIDLPAGRVV